jgi:NADPH-dependent glutamate synthase beta subunit-like oxidoreductase
MPAILVHVPPAPVLNGYPRLEQMTRMQQDLAATQHAEQDQTNSAVAPKMLRRLASKTGRKPRVAIVGAGFAGLRAADELLKHGVQVTIFEARDRLGGRVCASFNDLRLLSHSQVE